MLCITGNGLKTLDAVDGYVGKPREIKPSLREFEALVANEVRHGKRLNFMAKKVRIPTPLRKLTNNEEVVEVNANTIGEAILELQTRYPGIQERLVDEKGEVRRFVNVYVNEEDIRFLKESEHPLE